MRIERKQKAKKVRNQKSIEEDIQKLKTLNDETYRKIQYFNNAAYVTTDKAIGAMKKRNTEIKRLQTELRKLNEY